MSENKSKKLPQFLAAISICIGAMGTGTVIGWTSNIADSTFLQLFIGFGILYSNVFGWAVEVIMFYILCAAVPLVFGLCFMFQPETPVYLIKKEKIEKALVAYQRLRGKDYDASREIDTVQTQKTKEDEFKEQFTETLKTKAGWKSSLICFSLMFHQQLSGINAVVFYSGAIFKDAGSTIKPEFCAIIIGVVGVFGTFFSSWSIDKLGRKILLMFSLGIMALSTFLLGIYFLMKDKTMVTKDTLKSIGWLPLMSLLLFVIAFSIGIGPIPWIASSEIFPPAIMARMSSYACMFNWFLAFLVTVGYEPLSLAVGAFTTFFIFTIVSATGVFFVLFVIPETKGKSFQEIQDALAS